MFVTCSTCGAAYDDTYHLTICPHEWFPMNTIVYTNGVQYVAHSIEELNEILQRPVPSDMQGV